jgi:ADP-heptose:LPS heptosyltransferase
VLSAVLAHVDIFFCADTGPLHLADAAGANCVGLFNVTTPEHFGCLGNRALNIDDIEGLDPFSVLSHFGIRIKENGRAEMIHISEEHQCTRTAGWRPAENGIGREGIPLRA